MLDQVVDQLAGTAEQDRGLATIEGRQVRSDGAGQGDAPALAGVGGEPVQGGGEAALVQYRRAQLELQGAQLVDGLAHQLNTRRELLLGLGPIHSGGPAAVGTGVDLHLRQGQLLHRAVVQLIGQAGLLGLLRHRQVAREPPQRGVGLAQGRLALLDLHQHAVEGLS